MDKTIYERQHSARTTQQTGIALGRISSVDIDKRLCTVKTFHGPPGLIDLDLAGVQWADWDTNDKGDEATAIPRAGTVGLVFFVEGEPFFWGCINALNKVNSTNLNVPITGKEAAKLVQGDKIISTKAGNRVLVKSNGMVELRSKATLYRVMLPTDSEIRDICRNYTLNADGGYVNWRFTKTGQTLWDAEYRSDLARSLVVKEQRGSVDGTVLYRDQIGPGGPGGVFLAPVYSKEIDATGKTTLIIGAGVPVLTETRGPDGSVSYEQVGDFSVKSMLGGFNVELDTGSASIKATVGDITNEATAGHYQIHSGLDTAVLSDAGDVDCEATTGAFKATGSQAKLVLDKGKVALGGPTAELLDLLDQFMDVVKTVFDAMALETHTGNLGYPTSPPLNASIYTQGAVLTTQIKTLLGTIKGSL